MLSPTPANRRSLTRLTPDAERRIAFDTACKNCNLEALYAAYRECLSRRRVPSDYKLGLTLDELRHSARAYRLKLAVDMLTFIEIIQSGRTTLEKIMKIQEWLDEFAIPYTEAGLSETKLAALYARAYDTKP